MNLGLILMQDGAPGYRAETTQEDLRERSIQLIFWPPYSPDLNPIETVWDLIKDYIQENYPEHLTPTQLRRAVMAAWESISEEKLRELVGSIQARYKAVIRANGMHTEY